MAKILVVDDESTIIDLFKYIFEDAGHEVTTARDGREALSCVKASLPEFIVLDVAMPGMSGKEFVLELRRLSAQDRRLAAIPIVVMTGENFMDHELNRVFAAHPGFVCYLPKMTPPEEVLKKAESVL